MKTRFSLFFFYLGISLFCGLILFLTNLINAPQSNSSTKNPSLIYTDLNDSDLKAVNQEGEIVSLQQLKGKVWIFCQFFIDCPQCAKRSYEDLRKIEKKFHQRKDFHIVCISIDPEKDRVEQLKKYAQVLGAETRNWWLLTGEKKKLYAYMREKMLYPQISQRTDPKEIAQKGKFKHDLSIALFDRNLRMREKINLTFVRDNYGKTYYKESYQTLLRRIKQLLKE